MPYRYWTKEEERYLAQHYGQDMYSGEIAEHLGRAEKAVQKKAKRMGLESKLKNPYNKGMSYTLGAKHHSYKEPGKPYQSNGDMWIKPADGQRIMLYRRYVWEQYHGPLKPGQCISHKDGNKMNCDISNLECISRRQLAIRNRRNGDRSLHQARIRITRNGETWLDQVIMGRI